MIENPQTFIPVEIDYIGNAVKEDRGKGGK